MAYILFDPIKIGKRIQSERKVAGLSQKDLAKELNYESRQPIAAMENGEAVYGIRDMLKLCEIFKCDLGYLLCEYDCKTRTATDINAVTGLSEEVINRLDSWNKGEPRFTGYGPSFIDFLNEIIPKLPDSVADNYETLQTLRKEAGVHIHEFNEDERDQLALSVIEFVKSYPKLYPLHVYQAAPFFANEIGKAIDTIIRKEFEMYGKA